MKYKINKYRSIVSQEFDIEFGKINFFIGGNESGKSNILKSINFMGRNSKDKFIKSRDETKIAKWFLNKTNNKVKKDFINGLGTSFEIFDNDKTLKITTGGEAVWLLNNSSHHNELKLLFGNESSDLGRLAIEFPNYASVIQNAEGIVKNQFPTMEKLGEFLSLENLNEEFKNKIEEIYESAELEQPYTYIVIPYNKSSKEEKLEYRIADINKANSQINAIFTCFGDKEELKKLYSQTGEDINMDLIDNREGFLEHVNNEIRKYFDNFKFIKAVPELMTDNSIVYLKIKEKEEYKYEIHTIDENERSLGYKYFSRLILEFKSLAETTSPNNRIIYMIDEPEQSLHPNLQEILIKEMKKLIKNKNNIAVVLATHSIYAFDKNCPVYFVERNMESTEKTFFGETKLTRLSDKSYKEKIMSDSDESEYIKRIILDKWKTSLLKDDDLKSIFVSKDANTIDWIEGRKNYSEFVDGLSHIQDNRKTKKK